MVPSAAHHRNELIGRAAQTESVAELFGAASEHLRRLVPFDAALWLATDPATNLPTAPTRSENLAHVTGSDWARRLQLELLGEDVNLFRDLARADTPAAGLRMATRERPARSARYREFLRPNGVDDELRAVMRVDGSTWASIGLFREEGRPAFDVAETELVASLSGPLAAAVRHHARPHGRPATRTQGLGPGPGLMLFAPDGELVSVNDDALAWLEEITWLEEVPVDLEREVAFGIRLPMAVAVTVLRARAIADQRDQRSARTRIPRHGSGCHRGPAPRPALTRIRSKAGRWLVCHASCVRGANGEIGNTALVIEPAKAAEIAPIIIQAYELSAREQEITQLISQGLATAEIAGRLYLSPHTVRDYVKAIFEKVGVSSRGELVAELFAEHYAPIHSTGHEPVGQYGA